jgi:hypothetical protein
LLGALTSLVQQAELQSAPVKQLEAQAVLDGSLTSTVQVKPLQQRFALLHI